MSAGDIEDVTLRTLPKSFRDCRPGRDPGTSDVFIPFSERGRSRRTSEIWRAIQSNVSILVDLLISAPVIAFLLWLYVRSAPLDRGPGLRAFDRTLLIGTPIVAAMIIVAIHRWLDLEGMGRNVILVATAYLAVLAVPGFGWAVRFLRQR